MESGKWDAGLKKAQSELNRFIQTQGGLEAAMKADSQAMTQFVGMMGKMESTAKTARGQVNEYKNTIEQLSRVYNQLSASDKNSSIGRTLNQSIEQLTSKMRDAQNEMRNTSQLMGEQTKAGGELSNILDGVAGKFGLSTRALTTWGAALAGVTTALSVAKDAFFSNEQQLDEWGRTVESCESLYKGFLDSLGSTGVSVNLDTANLVMVTGDDPSKAVHNLKDYIVHTHAKDGKQLYYKDPEIVYGVKKDPLVTGPSFLEVPLGEGSVNWDEYLNALREIGFGGFLTIEREVGDDPEKDIRTAVDFLKARI